MPKFFAKHYYILLFTSISVPFVIAAIIYFFTGKVIVHNIKYSADNPAEVIIKPPINVDKKLAVFSGKWKGKWQGITESYLIVKEVKPDHAKVYYCWDNYEPANIEKGAIELTAYIVKDKNYKLEWYDEYAKNHYSFVLNDKFKSLIGTIKGIDNGKIEMFKQTCIENQVIMN